MPVRVHNCHQYVEKFSLNICIHLGIYSFKMLKGKIVQQKRHLRLFLLVNPGLLEWLEEQLVELAHKAEAGPFVKEVELFVVFVTTLYFAL